MNKNLIISLILMSMFLIPASTLFVSAPNEQIGVKDDMGTITISTEKITIKIVPNQAHIMWWFGNKTENDEMYKLQLLKIREFTGDDSVLDNQTEFGGINYNLVTGDWDYDIVEGDTELTITLSLLGLANGANMYVVMHVYNIDTPINGTDQVVDALSELKFDIIIDNWDFSPTAQGYAIQTYITEVQHHHRVQVRNGTVAENGNTTRTMQFMSDEYNAPVAYCEWTNFANIYNDTDDLIDTIEVGTAYFDTLPTPPPEAPGFAEGLAHLFLTYPNYGDGYKMIHDPSVGINEESFTQAIPFYIFPVVAGILAITTSIIIIKRRKQ